MTFYKAFGTVAAVLFVFVAVQGASAQGRLPAPIIYSGAVTISGAPLTDGLVIRAHMRDYTSEPRAIVNGRYEFLVVQPPDDSYNEEIITFTIDGVKAVEFDTFVFEGLPKMDLHFDLTLLALPQPTPTVITIPPTPTPTPQIARPSAYTGRLIIAGGQVPETATLVARIGSYESLPALIDGNTYAALVVDPRDFDLVGAPIEFVLNGIVSSIVGVYTSGHSFHDFDLIFVDFPTPTPTPTAPATATPTPIPTATPTATNTPEPPTATATATPSPAAPTAAPTRTPRPATATPTRTATPRPTATRPPATATPARPTSTPRAIATFAPAQSPTPPPQDDTGGMCSSVGGDTNLLSGTGNLLALFGPLGLIVAGRRFRRKP
ncbi:MAG: hypothetical protein CL694_04435 [Chloroflexi bacterium]|nr:hypothetical protein [Chloroflexota bacterium]